MRVYLVPGMTKVTTCRESIISWTFRPLLSACEYPGFTSLRDECETLREADGILAIKRGLSEAGIGNRTGKQLVFPYHQRHFIVGTAWRVNA